MAADPAGEPPGAAYVPPDAADELWLLAPAEGGTPEDEVLADVQADRPAATSNAESKATADVVVRETGMSSILPYRVTALVRACPPDTLMVLSSALPRVADRKPGPHRIPHVRGSQAAQLQ